MNESRGAKPHAARPYLAPLLAVAIALGWLNQGVSLAHYDELRAKVEAQPNPPLAERCRVFLSLLYRKSNDEELYYATARAILGMPFDSQFLARTRGDVPGPFATPPPSDGRPHLPYVEVAFEYPPLALPFILLPAAITSGFEGFAHLFGLLMGACLIAAMSLSLRARPETPSWKQERWWLASGLLLVQGGIAIQRLDAVVALFLSLALWAAIRHKPWLFGLAMGLGIGIKFLPALFLAPLLAVDSELLRDRRVAMKSAGGLAIGVFVSFAPMLLWWRHALTEVLGYHFARGLQVESSLGVGLAAMRVLLQGSSPSTLSFGSFNLTGSDADRVGALSLPLLLGATAAWSWYLFRARNRIAGERTDALTVALLGGCVAVWLCGKIFSPQYLTWAMALVLALSERPGRKVTALLIAAMALTQLYHRGYYDYVVLAQPRGLVTVLVRQAVLLAMAVVLVRWVKSGPSSFGRTAMGTHGKA